jgi:hypothetical protein
MPNVLILARRLFLRLIYVVIAGSASHAVANSVQFVGNVGYSNTVNFAILNADQIRNSGAVASGSLRLELWATPAPFSGSMASGYMLAQYPLGPLAAGASLNGVTSGMIPYTLPPGGLWYVSMVLTEYTGGTGNGGYASDNYRNFPNPINGSGPPPPPPTTATVSSSANPAVVGSNVTFIATVTGTAPAGSVNFKDGATSIASCAAVPLTGSGNARTAACSTTALAAGSHGITAVYSGDAANVGSTSAVLTQNVTGVVAAAPTLQTAVSRKVHGAAGTFDLSLSLVATNPSTEPRAGPAATVVLTFNKPLSGATVKVTEGTATVGAPTFSGNSVVVNLTGVADRKYVTVSLTNVASTDGGTGGSGSVRIGFLAGDVNQSRAVTMADVAMLKAQLSQPVTAAIFLLDVNASGTLTLADKGFTSTKQSRALPAP